MAETIFMEKPPGEKWGLESLMYLVSCQKCGRKVLVAMALFGIPHHTGLAATCAECVEIDDDWRRDHPEEARQIEAWRIKGE